MQKRTRSILDELAHMPVGRDRENLVESRAGHVIQGAINLINYINPSMDLASMSIDPKENYLILMIEKMIFYHLVSML